MDQHQFTTIGEFLEFAKTVDRPFSHMEKPKREMNSRELVRLKIRKQWVFGIQTEHHRKNSPEVLFSNIHDYIDVASLWEDYIFLLKLDNVRITGFYSFQLGNNQGDPIYLENLKNMPLSSQLQQYTGDSYNSLDFHNEGDEENLWAAGIIVHKKSGQRFIVPAAEVSVYNEI
jgi:hypothetical protein